MDKKIIPIIIAIALVLIGVSLYEKPESLPAGVPAATEEEQVRTVVTEFGNRLKNVSLLSESTVKAEIRSEYGPFISPLLLSRWENDPLHAPGRITSSPWPEKIEIKNMQKVGEYYEVEGELVEMTSAGEVWRGPVFLTVANISGKWLVAEYQTSME